MIALRGVCALLVAAVCGSTALAEDMKGHWIRQGTYALSGFAENAERDGTYRGASRERSRLFSYLPAMTIVFPDYLNLFEGAAVPEGYQAGITQTGAPVMVLRGELSRAPFGNSDTQDVVVHAEHTACPTANCDLETDGRQVEEGQSYKLIDDSTGDLIHLNNPSNEADFYYRAEEFQNLERRGTLTVMKDRVVPRWEIREGYAKELSAGCNRGHPSGMKFTVDAEAYEKPPTTWALNATQWSIKAADLYVGSKVEKAGSTYTAEIIQEIHDVTKPNSSSDDYQSAIDFTVFAYRDRDQKRNQAQDFQYAVLISIVACKKMPPFGQYEPNYVREAFLRFEDNSYELPQQVEESAKDALSRHIGRSFMYSVNTPAQYKELFGVLASSLDVDYSDVRANLVATVLARLNATCDRQRRSACSRIVKAHAVRHRGFDP